MNAIVAMGLTQVRFETGDVSAIDFFLESEFKRQFQRIGIDFVRVDRADDEYSMLLKGPRIVVFRVFSSQGTGLQGF
jgi:hypothetical protein